jgi:competence protein ComEC
VRGILHKYRQATQHLRAGHGTCARPVIPLLTALLCGMIVAPAWPGFCWWAAAVLALSSARLIVCIRLHKSCCLAPLCMFMALGYLSLQTWLTPPYPANHVGQFSDDRKHRLSGTVAGRPVQYNGRLRFFLEAEEIEQSRAAVAVVGKIRVTVTGDRGRPLPEIRPGDRITLNGRIRPIRNFNNPGGFDYQRYMAFKAIRHSTYCRAAGLTVLESAPPGPFGRIIENLREEIVALIATTPEGDQRGVMQALLIGERSQIAPDLRHAFHRVGVSHLLAISGLHVGIVATLAFFLFQRLFAAVPALLWSAWSRKLAAVCAFLPVLLYACLSGMSPSTQRATLMVGVFLSTFLFQRDQDAINTLAAAALAILIISPPAVFTISFQLSFAAVFWILYGMKQASSRGPGGANPQTGGPLHRFLSRGLKFVLVSTFATLGTVPLVLLHFNHISLIGIPANCVLVPLIGFAVVPVGLAGVFLAPLSPTLAGWCMQLAAAVLVPALKVIDALAALPFAAVYTVTPSPVEVAGYYALLWAALHLIFPRRPPDETACRLRSEADREDLRRRKRAAMGLVLVLAVLGMDALYWGYQRFWRDDLRITVLDVGQGSAAVLELPRGHTMLIDGGGFSDNSVFDVGRRVVAPFLWRRKIRTVDTLVLTHPNSDHLNGLLFIADHFHVREVWSNGESHTTLGFQLFEEIIARRAIPRPKFADMLRQRRINGVTVSILHPPRDFLQRRDRERWRSLNNNSLVLKTQMGRYAFLFPGDISHPAERELVDRSGRQLKSTVLCVPHHGSRSSSAAEFIDAVNPSIGLFCVGWHNRFHFPNAAVVERYRRRGVHLLRTDRDGAIQFVTDGSRFSVSTHLNGRLPLTPEGADHGQNAS